MRSLRRRAPRLRPHPQYQHRPRLCRVDRESRALRGGPDGERGSGERGPPADGGPPPGLCRLVARRRRADGAGLRPLRRAAGRSVGGLDEPALRARGAGRPALRPWRLGRQGTDVHPGLRGGSLPADQRAPARQPQVRDRGRGGDGERPSRGRGTALSRPPAGRPGSLGGRCAVAARPRHRERRQPRHRVPQPLTDDGRQGSPFRPLRRHRRQRRACARPPRGELPRRDGSRRRCRLLRRRSPPDPVGARGDGGYSVRRGGLSRCGRRGVAGRRARTTPRSSASGSAPLSTSMALAAAIRDPASRP